jgi:RNA polymerase sigma-70 factor, ECF subfamily
LRLDDFVVLARAPWPEWAGTDAQAFEAFVAALGAPLEDLKAADLWLAFHAGRGLAPAVVALESSCFSDLAAVLRARRADAAEADEIVQRVRDRLLVAPPGETPRILSYAGRGDLRAWVRIAAVRTWLNAKRETKRTESTDDALAEMASSDLELEILKGKYREVFRRVFLEAVAHLEPPTKLLLKLHYLDRLSMDEVGKILGVHRLTVLRRLERARQELAESTKERLETELRLAPPEVESLLRLIQSRLDVSLQNALAIDGGSAPHTKCSTP